MYTNDCSEPEYDDGVDDHNYVVTGCERDDYDPQLDEMRLREEIDFFLDHLSTEQFGAALLWMSTYDDQKEAVLNRWVGALFLGVQPLPHEIAQVRDWMTDYLSTDIIMYKELLDLYS